MFVAKMQIISHKIIMILRFGGAGDTSGVQRTGRQSVKLREILSRPGERLSKSRR